MISLVNEEREGLTHFVREEVTADRISYETGITRAREIARGQILGDDSGNFPLSSLDWDLRNRIDRHRRWPSYFGLRWMVPDLFASQFSMSGLPAYRPLCR